MPFHYESYLNNTTGTESMHCTRIAKHTIFSFLLLLALAGCSQWMDFSPAIPADPAVTVGKLDNGLTYYIRKNAKPAKRAELRLIVNADRKSVV